MAKRRAKSVTIVGEQATRLEALAHRWGVSTNEALRRALDQAFVGRGALSVLEAGFILLEHLSRKKPEELKKPEEPKAGKPFSLTVPNPPDPTGGKRS